MIDFRFLRRALKATALTYDLWLLDFRQSMTMPDQDMQMQDTLEDMRRRVVAMPDGRYQSFYTFGAPEAEETAVISEETHDV